MGIRFASGTLRADLSERTLEHLPTAAHRAGVHIHCLDRLDPYGDATWADGDLTDLADELEKLSEVIEGELGAALAQERRIAARDPTARASILEPMVRASPLWRELAAVGALLQDAARNGRRVTTSVD